MDMVNIKRFDVVLTNLDPTIGSEIKKIRPVVIVSPDSMNLSRLKTVIVAPMTSIIQENFPTRVMTKFKSKKGQVALDQLRAIDRSRFIQQLGALDKETQNNVLHILMEMFKAK